MADRPDSLIDFVAAISGDSYLKVEEDLGGGYVRLRVSEAERRQAKHDIRRVEDVIVELLRNARDAHSQRIFVSSHREGEQRTLTVIDDGIGIPTELKERIFEPRVTSKLDTMVMDRWGVHGRGMALFSVKSNVATARVAASESHRGTSVTVTADTVDLPERADQSTRPVLERTEEGSLRAARGPHNIIRSVAEFALEYPGVDVYLGTPTEILATLWSIGRESLGANDPLSVADLSRLPLWQRPAAASDAEELSDLAQELAIPISERTAHRILAGQIAGLAPLVADMLKDSPHAAEEQPPDIYRDRRGLKIHHSDISAFGRDLTAAFDSLAEKYYLHLVGEPRITVGKDELRVRFVVEKED